MGVVLDLVFSSESKQDTEFSCHGSFSQVDQPQEAAEVKVPPLITDGYDFRYLPMTALGVIPCVFGKRPETVFCGNKRPLPISLLNSAHEEEFAFCHHFIFSN